MKLEGKRMGLETVILMGITQTQKETLCMFSLISRYIVDVSLEYSLR